MKDLSPGLKALILIVVLYVIIQSIVSLSTSGALFLSVAITAFFVPALISAIVEIGGTAFTKIKELFDNKPKSSDD